MTDTNALAVQQRASVAVEAALVGGDLSKLPTEQRVEYYNAVCTSLGLNPLTKPFAYISLNGKLVLYALKDCTEQLRAIHNISLTITSREVLEGVYVVTARAIRPDGRQDESTGAVPIDNLKGEARANAMMKAETKAKRRITLSICGLGMLDETEADSIPGARFEGGSKEQAAEVGQERIKQLSAASAVPLSPEIAALVDTIEPEPTVEAYEQRSAPLEMPKKATKAKQPPPAIGYQGLERFGNIKKVLATETDSDDCYYAVLASFSYKHANEIPDPKSAEVVYKSLNRKLVEIRSNKVNRAECQEIFDRVGGEAFWAFAGNRGLDTEAYANLAGIELQVFTNAAREEFPA